MKTSSIRAMPMPLGASDPAMDDTDIQSDMPELDEEDSSLDVSPLAEISDEQLIEEALKRGLIEDSDIAPSAPSSAPMMTEDSIPEL